MTQKTFIQIESRKVENWLRTLQHCRNNLFLKDWVEHIDDSMTAIKEALAQPPLPAQECPNLEDCKGFCFQCEYFNAETGMTEYPAAQPAQEPVDNDFFKSLANKKQSPDQRPWVGLTDEEAQWLYDNCRTPSNLIDMVEARLKEKNT